MSCVEFEFLVYLYQLVSLSPGVCQRCADADIRYPRTRSADFLADVDPVADHDLSGPGCRFVLRAPFSQHYQKNYSIKCIILFKF